MDAGHNRGMNALDADPVDRETCPRERSLQYRRRGQSVGIVVVNQGNLIAGSTHQVDAVADLSGEVFFAHVKRLSWFE